MRPITMPLSPRQPLGELNHRFSARYREARLPVREVLSRIERGPALAYTTVLTVLDGLHDSGLVAREKERTDPAVLEASSLLIAARRRRGSP